MLFHGLLRWGKAELANAWTYVVRPRPLKRTSRKTEFARKPEEGTPEAPRQELKAQG